MNLFQFIVTNIFMIAVSVVLYMVVRTLPRIGEEPAIEKKGVFERWITSEIPEKIDKAFNGFLFKSIKKARVLLLRFDNTLGAHLKKIKPDGNGADKPHLDFSAMAEEKKSEEVVKDSGLGDNN